MPTPIRVPRPVDPDVFIPIDWNIALGRRYLDKSSGQQRVFRHIRAVTPRNIAKSYAAIGDLTEAALRGHAAGDPNHLFIYMRRGVDELEQSFPTLYKEVGGEFPAFEFRQRGLTWEARPWGAPSSAWRVVCYGMALADVYKRRSSVWADVTTIFFDEFIDDGSRPLSREVDRFESFYDTVARNRFVRTIFAANPQFLTPGVSNPFFISDGVRVEEKMPEFVSLRPRSTLYWFPPTGRFGNQQLTDRQRELGDTDYSRMSRGGEFVHAYGIPTGKRGPHADPLLALRLDHEWYSIWTDDNGGVFADRGAPNTPDLPRYAMSPRDIAAGVKLYTWGDPLMAWVRERWREGAITFRDTSLYDTLQEIMARR